MAQKNGSKKNVGESSPGKSNTPPSERKDTKQRRMIFGFRAYATVVGSIPATLLNTAVPAFAIYRGDVTLPNVMLSDVMASHPLYSAFYTWGFTLTMAAVCFIFQEASVLWRREMPEARVDIDRFLVIMYTMCAPCLFGLVAFQYKSDMKLSELGSLHDMLNNFDFILWLAHVAHTGVFFLSACWMCWIYMWRLKPRLDAHQLVHSGDRFWRDFATLSVQLLLPFGIVVRFAHLLIGGNLCGLLLIIIEIGMIQCFVIAAFGGIFRCMMELDAEDPMVLWRHIRCGTSPPEDDQHYD